MTVDVPFAPDAYRFENSVRMAGPGCTFRPPGCVDMKAQQIPTLPDVKERLAVQGMEPQAGSAAEFAAYVKKEVDMWARIVKTVGITVD